METLDHKLSNLDLQEYIQTTPEQEKPSILNVVRTGKAYRFNLLNLQLNEQPQPGSTIDREHRHPVYHLVIYIAGSSRFSLDGTRHTAARGRLVLVDPNRPHTFTCAEEPVAYHALTFNLVRDAEHLQENWSALLSHYRGHDVQLPDIQHLDENTLQLLEHKFHALYRRLSESPIPWYQAHIRVLQLLGMIPAKTNASASCESRLAEKAQEFISTHYADPGFSLQGLADALHASPEHICRIFRKHHGTSPGAHRNRLRIHAARNLLCHTSLPCKAIADRLGYADHYTFSKAYKRLTGHSPSRERT